MIKLNGYYLLTRENASIILDAYKENKIDELMSVNDVSSFSELIELIFNLSKEEIDEADKKYKEELKKVKEDFKNGKQYVKVKKDISYVKMPIVEYNSVENFLIMYCVSNAFNSSVDGTVSNFTKFFEKHLGIILSKQKDSVLRQLRKREFKIANFNECNCNVRWNPRIKCLEIVFDIEKYNDVPFEFIYSDDLA